MSKRPVALIILDGWGYREDFENNAIAQAKTPFFDAIWKESPHALLEASGLPVGLPEGQMGNSEIGHTTIGAGRAIDTDLVRISKAISQNEFISNSAFVELFSHVKKYDSTLHVMGLLSSGGVHSHQDHLHAFLRTAKEAGITKLAIHAFTDGRDTAPRSAGAYLKSLEAELKTLCIGHIATVSGRFYAMDRDKNWHRLAKVEEAMFDDQAVSKHQTTPSQVVEDLYKEEKLDEHLEPIIFLDDQGKSYPLQENDGVFIFNYRPDRARMLVSRLHERAKGLNLHLVSMTEYDKGVTINVAFPPLAIETTLATEISLAGLRQVHIAETEKFPHATYFLNGGREEPHPGEEHVMLESRKDVQTHDQAPEMRAEGIADAALSFVDKTDFIFINFANPDMVGHTANVPAIIQAVEVVDAQLKRVVEAVKAHGGICLVTADHGNAEVNIDQISGEKHTAHTLNRVPVIGVGLDQPLQDGTLADLAPTILHLLELPVPKSMTGHNLLQ